MMKCFSELLSESRIIGIKGLHGFSFWINKVKNQNPYLKYLLTQAFRLFMNRSFFLMTNEDPKDQRLKYLAL